MRVRPFELERYFARYEFHAKHLLCASDCETLSIDELLSLEPGADKLLFKLRLGYTESQGSPGLRHEIARIYQTITPEEILVHAGAEEAIFLFMHAALSPGDHVIVHSPCYPSLAEVARSIGCTVSPWTAREKDGWTLDPLELESMIRSNTAAIVINLPHNPTGSLMPRSTFEDVYRIATTNGALLFSDEVYRETEQNPTNRLPSACDLGPRAVSLGVLSKTYGLPGLRIGWVASHNRDILRRMAELKDYTTICCSAPSELLAEIALRHRETLVRRSGLILSANLERLDEFFQTQPDMFSWVRPVAGSVGFPRLLSGDASVFCHELVESTGVLLLPGTLFEDTGNHIRFGFGRKDLPEALALLARFLADP